MTRHEILAQLFEYVPDKYQKAVGTFFYDVFMPVAIKLEEMYQRLDNMLKKPFATTAQGEDLEFKSAEQNIKRNPATFAEGEVTVTGDSGAILNVGDKVSSQTMTFSITEKKILVNGNATVKVVADVAGSAGNMPVGAVNIFPVTLPGLTSVTNKLPIAGGFDAQTDEQLREKYFLKVSTPSTSGNTYDYLLWAREVSGVGAVKVFPLWAGASTVKVLIIDSNGNVEDPTLIDDVKAHIESKRPIGADVTVEYAQALTVDIAIKLVLKVDVNQYQAELKIRAAITEYLKELAFRQNYISYAIISSKILQVDEVIDCLEFSLNQGTDNIFLSDVQVPVLGSVVISL